jgi:hypothetical protein
MADRFPFSHDSCRQPQTHVKPDAAITVFEHLVMSSKHIELLRNIRIINYTTRSHLVGYFYKICIMMHGPMNINVIYTSQIIVK